MFWTERLAETVAPFICHSASWEPFFQRRSALPSPLKSPTPTAIQLAGFDWTLRLAKTVAPFICHSARLEPFVHSKSLLPSPLKSLRVRELPRPPAGTAL